jgi:hypothetical protein
MSSVLLYKEPTNKYHLGTYMRDSLSNAMREPQVWNSLLEVLFCLVDVYCIHLSIYHIGRLCHCISWHSF